MENCILFPATCRRLPAIAFDFLQVVGDFLQLHFSINTPVCNFLQLHFVSCKLRETFCNCSWFPAELRGTSAVLRSFPASCAGLPYSSGGFPQVVGVFRRSPLVSCKLRETSGDLRKGKTGMFVTLGFFLNKLFLTY